MTAASPCTKGVWMSSLVGMRMFMGRIINGTAPIWQLFGDLSCYDEAGFTLDPYLPSAWQEPGTVIEIPARKYGRMNVLGFMNRKNDLPPFIFAQSVHTEVVIACFEECSKTLKKKTVVVMDNASVHTSEAFEACLPQWKKQGLIIKYLERVAEFHWRSSGPPFLPVGSVSFLYSGFVPASSADPLLGQRH